MAPLSQKKRAHTYHRHKLGIKHLMRTHGLCSYTWMLVYAVFIYVDACVSCTCARTGCVHICGCLCMLYMCTHGLCSYMLYMCTHGLCSYTWMPVYAVHVHTCCIHACLPILYIALVSLSLLLPSAPARTQKAPLCPANKKCVLYLLPILLRSILLPFFEPPSSQLHAHL